jgi:hypothetical protein
LRLNVGNYVVASAYGTFNIPSPNPENSGVDGKTIENFKFISPTDFIGPMIPDYSFPFDEASYAKIRKANFKVSSSESTAVHVEGAKYIPSFYTFASASIPITASIPFMDLLENDRPLYDEFNLDLGAYQFSGIVQSVKNQRFQNSNISTLYNTIIIKNMQDKLIEIYNMAGKLVHIGVANSNHVSVVCNKGIYIVKVEKDIAKVVVYH